jgi:hypothetical protein
MLAKLPRLSKVTVSGPSAELGLCRLENRPKVEIYVTIFVSPCFEQHEIHERYSMATITATRLDKTGDALAAKQRFSAAKARRP